MADFTTRADALARGFTDEELRGEVRRKRLVRIRRGVYVAADEHAELELQARYLLAVQAGMVGLKSGTVASHVSAGALHGLPLTAADLSRIHVSRADVTSRRTSRTKFHCLAVAEDQITEIDGVLATTLARTVVDLSLTLPFEQAVVAGDAALRKASLVLDPSGRRGVASARRAIAFLDGLSESVGESRSRVAIHLARLPSPMLQVRIYDAHGRFLARADFCWPELGLIGEFDGVGKYLRNLRNGQEPGDVVVAEKKREDRLRAAGWDVVRWTWSDLAEPEEFISEIRRKLARGRPSPSEYRLASAA